MKQILSSSISILLLKRYYVWYRAIIGKKRNDFWYNSHLYKLIRIFCEKRSTYFKYSALASITAKGQMSLGVLDNSRTIQYLFNFYKSWIGKIINYLGISLAAESAKSIKEQLSLFPVRVVSIILMTAVIVNLSLSIVLQRQIGLWGWLLRGLFLFVGVGGLSVMLIGRQLKKVVQF